MSEQKNLNDGEKDELELYQIPDGLTFEAQKQFERLIADHKRLGDLVDKYWGFLKDAAIREINVMGEKWARKDPDYWVKLELILKAVPHMQKQYFVSDWPAAIKRLYDLVGKDLLNFN